MRWDVASAEEGDEDLGGDAQGEGDEAKEPDDGSERAQGGHGAELLGGTALEGLPEFSFR